MKKRPAVLVLSLALFFLAAGPSAALQLESPQYGVSQNSSFDVSIRTETDLACRYSSPFERPFGEMRSFTTTGGTAHVLSEFTLPSAGTEYAFFINCGNGNETASLNFSVDETDPRITSVAAVPGRVVQAPLEARLVVRTSEASVCRYDTSDEDYDSMSLSFSPDLKENYREEHNVTLTGLADRTDYAYNIRCMDLSGRKTGLATARFSVNTTAKPEITVLAPEDDSYVSADPVLLSIRTNKESECSFTGSSDGVEMKEGTFSERGASHEARIDADPGEHVYRFRCVFEGPLELTAKTEFTVDRTPPRMLPVNDDQELDGVREGYTYRTDVLTAILRADDAESGIRAYNYTIIGGGRTVRNFTTVRRGSITARGLDLEDGVKYFFRASAQNRAGLWSSFVQSSGVTVDTSLNLEQACRNSRKDSQETDVDCGGTCPSKCALNKACSSGSDCASGYCLGGKCSAASCSDGIINQKESDVDCGGTCPKCAKGSKCMTGSDCSTGICSGSVCASPGPCSNGEMDGLETDVDCGGTCPSKCALEKACSEDADCASGTCGTEEKCVSAGDHDQDGVMSDADNCPSEANPLQKDGDGDGDGDVCDDDDDGDGIADAFEQEHGLDPLNGSDASIDSDGDGLSNLREFELGTDPHNPDTDGDGHSDSREAGRSNPNSSQSRPGIPAALKILFWLGGMAAVLVFAGVIYYRRVAGPLRRTHEEIQKRVRRDLPGPEEMQQPARPVPQRASPERGRQEIPRPAFQGGSGMQAPRGRSGVSPQHAAGSAPQPLYRPIPPPPRKHTKGNLDALWEEHSALSGEDVFKSLKRQTRRRRGLQKS